MMFFQFFNKCDDCWWSTEDHRIYSKLLSLYSFFRLFLLSALLLWKYLSSSYSSERKIAKIEKLFISRESGKFIARVVRHFSTQKVELSTIKMDSVSHFGHNIDRCFFSFNKRNLSFFPQFIFTFFGDGSFSNTNNSCVHAIHTHNVKDDQLQINHLCRSFSTNLHQILEPHVTQFKIWNHHNRQHNRSLRRQRPQSQQMSMPLLRFRSCYSHVTYACQRSDEHHVQLDCRFRKCQPHLCNRALAEREVAQLRRIVTRQERHSKFHWAVLPLLDKCVIVIIR